MSLAVPQRDVLIVSSVHPKEGKKPILGPNLGSIRLRMEETTDGCRQILCQTDLGGDLYFTMASRKPSDELDERGVHRELKGLMGLGEVRGVKADVLRFRVKFLSIALGGLGHFKLMPEKKMKPSLVIPTTAWANFINVCYRHNVRRASDFDSRFPIDIHFEELPLALDYFQVNFTPINFRPS